MIVSQKCQQFSNSNYKCSFLVSICFTISSLPECFFHCIISILLQTRISDPSSLILISEEIVQYSLSYRGIDNTQQISTHFVDWNGRFLFLNILLSFWEASFAIPTRLWNSVTFSARVFQDYTRESKFWTCSILTTANHSSYTRASILLTTTDSVFLQLIVNSRFILYIVQIVCFTFLV